MTWQHLPTTGFALALLIGASVGGARSASAQDIITFDDLVNEPISGSPIPYSGEGPLQVANGGSYMIDGVDFSGSTFGVFGDQAGLGNSHSGHYAIGNGEGNPELLFTTKTLFGVYVGQPTASFLNPATSLTITPLSGNGTTFAPLSINLSDSTLRFFDTSSFASLGGITGYRIEAVAANGNHPDYVLDDLTFSPAQSAAVPESSASALLALGLLPLAGLAARRRCGRTS